MPPWFPAWFEWRLFDGRATTRPSAAPTAIPEKYLDIVRQAERFRELKPDSGAIEIAALKAKIDAARRALA